VNEVQVVDPSGSEPHATGVEVAPRPTTLAGTRLGVLDNGKPNADHVVRSLGRHLHRRFGTQEPVAAAKAFASRPCPEDVLTRFRGFDAALVGVGD
jgi:hypothetical protein